MGRYCNFPGTFYTKTQARIRVKSLLSLTDLAYTFLAFSSKTASVAQRQREHTTRQKEHMKILNWSILMSALSRGKKKKKAKGADEVLGSAVTDP